MSSINSCEWFYVLFSCYYSSLWYFYVSTEFFEFRSHFQRHNFMKFMSLSCSAPYGNVLWLFVVRGTECWVGGGGLLVLYVLVVVHYCRCSVGSYFYRSAREN